MNWIKSVAVILGELEVLSVYFSCNAEYSEASLLPS